MKMTCPAYNPQSNPVERFHKSLGQILRCQMVRVQKDWTKFIGMAAFAYNAKIHDSTNISPFKVFMGRPA